MKNKIIAVITALSIAFSMFCYLPAESYADGNTDNTQSSNVSFYMLTPGKSVGSASRISVKSDTDEGKAYEAAQQSNNFEDIMDFVDYYMANCDSTNQPKIAGIELVGDVYVYSPVIIGENFPDILHTFLIAKSTLSTKNDTNPSKPAAPAVIHFAENGSITFKKNTANSNNYYAALINVTLDGDPARVPTKPSTGTNSLNADENITVVTDGVISDSENVVISVDSTITDADNTVVDNNVSEESDSTDSSLSNESENTSITVEDGDESFYEAENSNISSEVSGADYSDGEITPDSSVEESENGSNEEVVSEDVSSKNISDNSDVYIEGELSENDDSEYFESTSLLYGGITNPADEPVSGNDNAIIKVDGVNVRFTNNFSYIIADARLGKYFALKGPVDLKPVSRTGVAVSNGGALYMDMNSKIENGTTGVQVCNGGKFVMTGETNVLNTSDQENSAKISECETGVLVESGGDFTMKSASTISGCTNNAVHIKNGGNFHLLGNKKNSYNQSNNELSVYDEQNFVNTATSDKLAAIDGNGGTEVENGGTEINGGGLYIEGSAELVSGKITNNKADNGGGIYLGTGAELTLKPTNDNDIITITGNNAKKGGGVYVGGGTFNLNSGVIGTKTVAENTANTAELGGGVYVGENGVFTLSDSGSISGNQATTNGGGVFVGGGTFNLNGGVIGVKPAAGDAATAEGTANTAVFGGGVYYESGTFNMQGSPVVLGNTPYDLAMKKTETTDSGNKALKITVTGEVTDNAQIGIIYDDVNGTGIFTDKWSNDDNKSNGETKLPESVFKSNDPRYMVEKNTSTSDAAGNAVEKGTEGELIDAFHIHSPCGYYCTHIMNPENLKDDAGQTFSIVDDDGTVNWTNFGNLKNYDWKCKKHTGENSHKAEHRGKQESDVLSYLSVSSFDELQTKYAGAEEKAFYLTSDIVVDKFEVNDDFYLCLNGNTLTITGDGFVLKNNAKFTLDDCYYDKCFERSDLINDYSGKVVINNGATLVTNESTGAVTLYSGTIEGGTAVKFTSNGSLNIENAVLKNSRIVAESNVADINIHRLFPYGNSGTDVTRSAEENWNTASATMTDGVINAPNSTITITGTNDTDTSIKTKLDVESINGSEVTITYSDVTTSGNINAKKTITIDNNSSVTSNGDIEAADTSTSVPVGTVKINNSTVTANNKLGGGKETIITNSTVNKADSSCNISGKTITIDNSTVTGQSIVGDDITIKDTTATVSSQVTANSFIIVDASNVIGDVTVNSTSTEISEFKENGKITGQLNLNGSTKAEIGTFTIQKNSDDENSVVLAEGAELYLYDKPVIDSISCWSVPKNAPQNAKLHGRVNRVIGEQTIDKKLNKDSAPIYLSINNEDKVGLIVMQDVPIGQSQYLLLKKNINVTGSDYTRFESCYKELVEAEQDTGYCYLKIDFALRIDVIPDDEFNSTGQDIRELTPFVDSNFRAYLREISKNSDGTEKTKLTQADIMAICEKKENIDLTGRGVTSLAGIRYFGKGDDSNKYFGELKTLIVSGNQISSLENGDLWANELNYLKSTLTTLECSNCGFKNEDVKVSGFSELSKLDCSNNSLTALDVSDNSKLTYLDCSDNKLTELDVTQNSGLTYLDCSNELNNGTLNNADNSNSIGTLDLTNNTSLETLKCAGNLLNKTLDLTANTKLKVLDCSYQQGEQINNGRITQILFTNNNPSSSKLGSINCRGNNLYYLNLLNIIDPEAVQTNIVEDNYYIVDSCKEDTLSELIGNRVTVTGGATFDSTTGTFSKFDYDNSNGKIRYTYASNGAAGGNNVAALPFELRYRHIDNKNDYSLETKPTCTEAETVGGHTCTRCGELFESHAGHHQENDPVDSTDEDVIFPVLYNHRTNEPEPALGHFWVEHEAVDATCAQDGNKRYFTCEREEDNCKTTWHLNDSDEIWFIGEGKFFESDNISFDSVKGKFICNDTATEDEKKAVEAVNTMAQGKNASLDDWLTDTNCYTKSTTTTINSETRLVDELFLDMKKVPHFLHNPDNSDKPWIIASEGGNKLPTCLEPGYVDNFTCGVCGEHFNKKVNGVDLPQKPYEENGKTIDGEELRQKQDPYVIDQTPRTVIEEKDRIKVKCIQEGYLLKEYGHNFSKVTITDTLNNPNGVDDSELRGVVGTEGKSNEEYFKDNSKSKFATCTQPGEWEYWYCGNCGKYFVNRFATDNYTDDRTGQLDNYPGVFGITSTETRTGPLTLNLTPFALNGAAEPKSDEEGGVKIGDKFNGTTINSEDDIIQEDINPNHHAYNDTHTTALTKVKQDEASCLVHSLNAHVECGQCGYICSLLPSGTEIPEANLTTAWAKPIAPVDSTRNKLAQANSKNYPDNTLANVGLSDDKDVNALLGAGIWHLAGAHWFDEHKDEGYDITEWYAETVDTTNSNDEKDDRYYMHHYYVCPNPNCREDVHYIQDPNRGEEGREDRYLHSPEDGSFEPDGENAHQDGLFYHTYTCSKCKDKGAAGDSQNHTVQKPDNTETKPSDTELTLLNSINLLCVEDSSHPCQYASTNEKYKTHHYFKCGSCSRDMSSKEHVFSIAESDDDGHIQKCDICGLVLDKEPHGKLEITHNVTSDNQVQHIVKCGICKHVVANNTDNIDLWANYTPIHPDQGKHIYECTYKYEIKSDDGTVIETIECDEKSEEGHTAPPPSGSDKWHNSDSNDPAVKDEDNPGTHYYICEKCGQRIYESHDTSGEIRKDLRFDENYHWRECSVCGQPGRELHSGGGVEQLDPKDKNYPNEHYSFGCQYCEWEGGNQPHKWQKYNEDNENHYLRCLECGQEKTESHHYPEEWKSDPNNKNQHRKVCDTEIYVDGEKVPCGYIIYENHYGEITPDDNITHSGICDACGKEINKESHEGNWMYIPITNDELAALREKPEGEQWGVMPVADINKPIDLSNGDYNNEFHKKVCSICGYYEAVAHGFEGKEFHYHQGDTEEHYRICECGYELYEPHNMSEWVQTEIEHYKTCNDCDYESAHEEHKFIQSESDPNKEVCEVCGYERTKDISSIPDNSDTSSDPNSSDTSSDPNSSDTSSDPNSSDTSDNSESSDTSSDPNSSDSSDNSESSDTSSDPNSSDTSDNSESSDTSNDSESSDTSSDPNSSDTSSDLNSSGNSSTPSVPDRPGRPGSSDPVPPYDWDNSSNNSGSSSNSNGSGDNSNSSGGSIIIVTPDSSNSSDNSAVSSNPSAPDSSSNSSNSGSSGSDNQNPGSDGNSQNGIGVDTSDFNDLIITDSETDKTNSNGSHGNIFKVVRSGRDAPWTYLDSTLEELVEMLATRDDLAAVKDEAMDMEFLLTVRNADRTVSTDDRRITQNVASSIDQRIGQYLDISLYKLLGADRWQIHETEHALRIRFDIPERLKELSPTRSYTILRVHNGVPSFLDDLDRNPDTITIDTDRFSTYVILYNSQSESSGLISEGNNPYTGVKQLSIVPTVLAALTIFKTHKRIDE